MRVSNFRAETPGGSAPDWPYSRLILFLIDPINETLKLPGNNGTEPYSYARG